MSEHLQTTQSGASERAALEAKLAEQERQAQRTRTELVGKENFGVFDGEMVPNEGEVTSREYHAQRPSEGIVREGDRFRHTGTGQFAAEGEYEAQNTLVQPDYNEDVQTSGSEYDSMSFTQLAKEFAFRESLNDVAGMKEVRELAGDRIMEAITRPDKPATSRDKSPDEVYAQEMAQFDKMVGAFRGDADTVTNGEGEGSELPEAAATEVSDSVTETEKPDTSTEQFELNGEAVTLGAEFTDKDGNRVFEVTLPDGKTKLVRETDLTRTVIPGVQGEGAEALEGESLEEYEARNGGAEKTETPPSNVHVPNYPGQEVELYKGERDERAPGFFEKVKSWWGEKVAFAKVAFDPRMWAHAWHMRQDSFIERGVKDTMTDDEKEKKRNNNRAIWMYGHFGVVLAAGIAAGMGIHQAIDNANAQTVGLTDGVGELPQPVTESDPVVLGTATGSINGETAQPEVVEPEVAPVEAPAFGPEYFKIPPGGGGEALMNRLGIPAEEWYKHQAEWAAKYPNELYQMSSGNYGFTRPGTLSAAFQADINSLVK